ncbi:uncharacterized protein [Ptychodera flava]|uniref:uncharacterized protein n=1 Tax=Ptychodera flava TaxID=63121 RepID=UPI00396A489B
MHKGETRSKLEKGFLMEVDGLLDRLAILMKPKKAWPYVGNINGKQFAELLKEYVSELSSSDGVLNIHSVGSKVVETLLNDVQEKAFDKYTSKMDEFLKSALPCPNHEIIYKHKDCLDQAKKYFKVKSKYIKDFCSLKTQRKKLLENTAVYSDDGRTCVGGYLKTSLASNVKVSDAFCRKIADDLFKEKLRPLMDSYENGDSLQSIDVDLVINDVEREYKKRARGPQMWQVYKTELAEEISMFTASVSKLGAGNSSEKLEVMKAEEEEKKDQENVEKQMLNLKTNEEKTMRLTLKEDIVEQQKELANDLEESTAAILSQVSQLLKSHPGWQRSCRSSLPSWRKKAKHRRKS